MMFIARNTCKQVGRSLLSQTVVTSRYASTIRFTKSHEYIKLDGDVGTIGITEHAAKALGDVVYVDLPNIGTKYSSGDSFGSVESVKAASDVYSPVDGEVVAINNVSILCGTYVYLLP